MTAMGALLPAAGAESSLSWRVFKKDENTWIYYPKGLMLFSTLSRSVKPFPIDPIRSVDTLTDCIEYDGYLWVVANAGLYQIDMATQSVERITLPGDSTVSGKIAQDVDYLWLAAGQTLMRFDKLGREWMHFPLPAEGTERIVGLWADGEEVFWLGKTALYRFTSATEKWNAYPLDKPLGDGVVFYPGMKSFKVIDGTTVSLYQPASFSWRHTSLAVTPRDVFDEDSAIYISDGKGVRKIACETGMTKVLNLPNPGEIRAIATMGDSLVLMTDKRIGKFALEQETMTFLEYDQKVQTEAIQKVVPLSSFFLIVTPEEVSCYDKEVRSWQHVPRAGFQQKRKVFSWNEDECVLRYAPGYQSTISGSVRSGMTFDWEGYDYDTTYHYPGGGVIDTVIDSIPLVNYAGPDFIGNVNVHTSDRNDRIADVFFNNSSRVTAPSKGLYFRGNRDDYLNTLRIGTTSSDLIKSPLLPEVSMEGGTAVLESRARLETRDRKIARLAGGTGYITTKTITRMLPYRADGTYRLTAEAGVDSTDSTGVEDSTALADTVRFVKGSCKVTVDGETLDTTLYNFYVATGKLQFNALAPIDPVSSIVVEYQVQTVPEGDISNVEIIPSHRFGTLHFGSFTLSPKEWISAQVGYTGVDRDTLNSIFNVAVPLEFRNNDKKMMLKFRPEFLYDINSKAKAGGAELQSRLGAKTGLLFNGLLADSTFTSTDTLTRGYGTRRSEYDFTLSHDIKQELPLSYYQHQRFGADGNEDRFAFSAGARFNGYPFLEVTVSRNVFELTGNGGDSARAIDSLFHKKDKVKIRLYETSSTMLEKLTRFYKISYDATHSEYRSRDRGAGEWTQGRLSSMSFSLAPIQRIMLSGEMLYRGGMHIDNMPSSDVRPAMTLQMIDAPPGIDLSVIHSAKFSRFAPQQYSTDTLDRSLSVVLKPGQWFSFLGWFSPRGKVTQNVRCRFSSIHVPFWDIASGIHDRQSASLAREIGVNIYPIEGLLYTNTNEWAKSDGLTSFRTNNRFQYIFDARNTIDAYWNYSESPATSRHDGSLSYDKLWTSWLRTTPLLKTDIKNDATGNTISIGPKLTVNFNVLNFRMLRALSNYHEVEVKWNRHNSVTEPTPDVTYNVGLRVKTAPNIEFQVKNTTFKFIKGEFSDFGNEILLSAYF